MFHDSQFEVNEVVGVHPVFSSLTNKSTLAPTSTRISLDRVSSRPNQIIQLRQLYNETIPVVFVERTLFKVILNECRF